MPGLCHHVLIPMPVATLPCHSPSSVCSSPYCLVSSLAYSKLWSPLHSSDLSILPSRSGSYSCHRPSLNPFLRHGHPLKTTLPLQPSPVVLYPQPAYCALPNLGNFSNLYFFLSFAEYLSIWQMVSPMSPPTLSTNLATHFWKSHSPLPGHRAALHTSCYPHLHYP